MQRHHLEYLRDAALLVEALLKDLPEATMISFVHPDFTKGDVPPKMEVHKALRAVGQNIGIVYNAQDVDEDEDDDADSGDLDPLIECDFEHCTDKFTDESWNHVISNQNGVFCCRLHMLLAGEDDDAIEANAALLPLVKAYREDNDNYKKLLLEMGEDILPKPIPLPRYI